MITDRLRFSGGVESYIQEFATAFRAKGYHIDALPYFQDETQIINGDVSTLSYDDGEHEGISRAIAFVRTLRRLHASGRYTDVFLHLYIAPFLALFFRFPRWRMHLVVHGVRYLEIMSEIPPLGIHRVRGIIKRSILFGPRVVKFLFVQWFSVYRARHIIVLSEYMRQQLVARFSIPIEKTTIIPGVVNQRVYRAGYEKNIAAIRRSIGISDAVKLVVLVSRIEPRKNIIQAIDAFSFVAGAVSEAMLLIISPADDACDQVYLAQCYDRVSRNNLGGRVMFTTGIPRRDLVSYYHAADVSLLVSSGLETFGFTMMESLLCGTPVVGTAVGNIPDVLRRIDNRLVAKVSARSIARAVIYALTYTRTERRAVSEKGVCTAKQICDARDFVSRYEAIMTS